MMSNALSGLALLLGVALWAVGGWQVYESNALIGAVLVLVGGLLVVSAIAWWRRDRDAGFGAVLEGIVAFISRA